MMATALTVIEEVILTACAKPDGLVLAKGAPFTWVHIELWKKGYIRLFQPNSSPRRLVATAAGLRAIGVSPEPLRAVQ